MGIGVAPGDGSRDDGGREGGDVGFCFGGIYLPRAPIISPRGLIIIHRRAAIHSEAGRPESRVKVRTASRVQDWLYPDRALTYADVSTRPNALDISMTRLPYAYYGFCH